MSSSNAAGTFPIALTMWQNFEIAVTKQAKKLVEDISRKQGVDSKELWTKVSSKIRIGLLDFEQADETPSFCSYMLPFSTGAMKMRCRAPCFLGFSACPEHIGKTEVTTSTSLDTYPTVTRVFDLDNKHYFIDEFNIARDRNGIAKGTVSEDGTLLLFEVWKKPPTTKKGEEA